MIYCTKTQSFVNLPIVVCMQNYKYSIYLTIDTLKLSRRMSSINCLLRESEVLRISSVYSRRGLNLVKWNLPITEKGRQVARKHDADVCARWWVCGPHRAGPTPKWVDTHLVEIGRENWGWEREERPLTESQKIWLMMWNINFGQLKQY